MQNQPIEANLQGLRELTPAAGEDSCMLTTYDRESGMAHEVAMRFALRDGCIYLLSDEGGDAQWVQNILRNPEVSLRIGSETVAGMARTIADGHDAAMTRQILAAKYEGWREGQPLGDWAQNALPVVLDLAPGRSALTSRETHSLDS